MKYIEIMGQNISQHHILVMEAKILNMITPQEHLNDQLNITNIKNMDYVAY